MKSACSAKGYFFLCIVNFVCDDLGVKTGKNIYFLSELSLSFTDPPFQSHVLNQRFKTSQVRNSIFLKKLTFYYKPIFHKSSPVFILEILVLQFQSSPSLQIHSSPSFPNIFHSIQFNSGNALPLENNVTCLLGLVCSMLQDSRKRRSRNITQKQRGGWEKTGKLGLQTFFLNLIPVFQPLVFYILTFSLEKRFFWKRAGCSGRTEVPPSLFPPFFSRPPLSLVYTH